MILSQNKLLLLFTQNNPNASIVVYDDNNKVIAMRSVIVPNENVLTMVFGREATKAFLHNVRLTHNNKVVSGFTTEAGLSLKFNELDIASLLRWMDPRFSTPLESKKPQVRWHLSN